MELGGSDPRPPGCDRAERSLRALDKSRSRCNPALEMSGIKPPGSARSCANVSIWKYCDVPVRHPPTPSEPVGVSLLLGLRSAHTLPSVDAVGGQGCGASVRGEPHPFALAWT